MNPFGSRWNAGFETGYLPARGDFCLASAAGHTPSYNMGRHYGAVRRLGVNFVRDGLLPQDRQAIYNRLLMSKVYRMGVVWDLLHYWPMPDPEQYARWVVESVKELYGCDPGLWFAFNETAFHPVMRPEHDYRTVIDICSRIWNVVKTHLPASKLLSVEYANSRQDLSAQDPWLGSADAFGLNIFPHELARYGDGPAAIVETFAERAGGKPIIVTETSLHVDHPSRWKGINSKAEWVRYLDAAVGDLVSAFFYYPIINSADWNDPHSGNRWNHGLILDHDLNLDAGLAEALADLNGVPYVAS